MSTSRILLAAVALTLALVGFQFWLGSHEPPVQTIPEPQNLPETRIQESAEVLQSNPVPTDAEDRSECMTLPEFENHPLTTSVIQDLAFLLPDGSDIDAYQGIDPVLVQSYADQGDSAAMVVLGAQAVMKAFGSNVADATKWLNGEASLAMGLYETNALSPEASLELNNAAFWFHEAALHGRLFSLTHYGSVRNRLFGGPVGLGWLTEDELGALPNASRLQLLPNKLYSDVVLEVAPKLNDSWISRIQNGLPALEPQRGIRESLAQDFNRALEDRGLSLPEIPAIPEGVDRLADNICSDQLR